MLCFSMCMPIKYQFLGIRFGVITHKKRERTIIVPSLKCYDFNRLSYVVFPLGVTHIAALEELLVHSQRATQYVRCVRRLCHSDILV